MKGLLYLLSFLMIYSCSTTNELSEEERKEYAKVEYKVTMGKEKGLYTKKHSEKFYHFHNNETKQRVKTKIKFFKTYYRGNTIKDVGVYAIGVGEDKKTLFILNSDKQNGIAGVIENVVYNQKRQTIQPGHLNNNSYGYLAVTSVGGQKYYQYINKNFEKGFRINTADTIRANGSRTPLIELDSGFFYPLTFDGNKILTKPEANSIFQGVELSRTGKNAMHSVYKDKNGKLFYGYKIANINKLTIVEHLKHHEVYAKEWGFYLIEKDLDGAEVTLGNALPKRLSLVQELSTKKYRFISYNDFVGYYEKIVMLLDGKRGAWAKHEAEFDTEESARYGLKRTMIMADRVADYKRKKVLYDAEMAKPNKWAQQNAKKRRAKEAALGNRVKESKQNNKNRARFSDIDLTGGQGGDEATRIKNAKCRDQANRQNRHAGKTRYACKNVYGK